MRRKDLVRIVVMSVALVAFFTTALAVGVKSSKERLEAETVEVVETFDTEEVGVTTEEYSKVEGKKTTEAKGTTEGSATTEGKSGKEETTEGSKITEGSAKTTEEKKPSGTTGAPKPSNTERPSTTEAPKPSNTERPSTTEAPKPSTTEANKTCNHNWVQQYKEVKHAEESHTERVCTSEAWDEPQYRFCKICNGCGLNMTLAGLSQDDCTIHVSDCQDGSSWHGEDVAVGSIHHEATYETRKVIDREAYTEKVPNGHKCSVCGATK